jgi:hypothetical protein
MNYHLSRDGATLGTFSLEELHRRRLSGELTGAEFVWAEGMPEWQSLDWVLRAKGLSVPVLVGDYGSGRRVDPGHDRRFRRGRRDEGA